MKARNRKTGEVVDIICYGDVSAIKRSSLDWINYIDSQGVEHIGENLNYYWDFDPIDDTQDKDSPHWQDVREHAAIAALKGLLSNPGLVFDNKYCSKEAFITAEAIKYANELVEKLKEK